MTIKWALNALMVERYFGEGSVDWEERCYFCPECGEPVYECDWTEKELTEESCPICGWQLD